MTSFRRLVVLMAAAAIVAAGCSTTGAVASPTPVASPVTTPDQAIARIVSGEPRLTGIASRDPSAIGQATWYDVQPGPSAGTFVVTTRIGWGDCQAHCINEHVSKQSVGSDGSVTLVSEAGPPIPEEAWPDPTAGKTGIRGSATAAPTCPVERASPDPSCAPRPIQGAVIVVRDASGAQVDRTVTNAAGMYFSAVGAGTYVNKES